MTKDEMKDRISMALKDPVLQQGFEVICKNLSHAEKEIDVLKKANVLLAGQRGTRDDDICVLEGQVEWLEKEVTELNTMKVPQLEQKLTEAKNHIHRLLVLLTEETRTYSVINSARAFLSEVSE